ncbi:MAG: shikimate dehydrogenase family protein [Christensenellales bacterium]
MRVKYDVDTKFIAQIGYPMDHSCASMLSNAMYEYANLNAVNLTFEIPRDKLADLVQAAKTLNMQGIDVTMPYKSEMLPFLDECTEEARAFNCINHVKIENGKLYGAGLDGVGMRMAIEKEGVDLNGRDLLILGAGAVSGQIAAELCKSGAKSVTVLNRTIDKAKKVTDVLERLYHVKTAYGEMTTEEMVKAAPHCNLVVQCTPLGWGGVTDYESVDFVSLLPNGSFVADVLYNPPRTKLLAAAEKRGLKVVNGAAMLFYQAQAAIKFQFGVDLPDDFVSEAEESILIAVAMRNFRKTKLDRKANKK